MTATNGSHADTASQCAALQQEILQRLQSATGTEQVEAIRIAEMGKKGRISTLLKSLGTLPPQQRKHAGRQCNELKTHIEAAIAARAREIHILERDARLQQEQLDVSLPVGAGMAGEGRIHPLSEVGDELLAIFASMGFGVEQGPDIETEYYNFAALNIGANHPARDMHDTFYLQPATTETPQERHLLRTHTSPVQIRAMERRSPPFRFVAPGRTYRRDSDQTHTPMFHQIEGMAVGADIHLGHLKATLEQFLRMFFEMDVELRLRPSFFPFTEPSLEVDVRCAFQRGVDGGGIKIGSGDDWLEILGCGMVHPRVLSNCGIDAERFQGFAFGAGIDRLAMLKYGIPDLRSFFDGDARWLRHYGFPPSRYDPYEVAALGGGQAP